VQQVRRAVVAPRRLTGLAVDREGDLLAHARGSLRGDRADVHHQAVQGFCVSVTVKVASAGVDDADVAHLAARLAVEGRREVTT
jgi:hypothetical protein